MAVFDVQEILTGGQTVLWYVPDLIDYLDPKKTFFSTEDRKWANNNQEYISWAFLPSDALVYWSTWEELASPDIGFLRERYIFVFWYTLALFERHTASLPLNVDEYVEKIVKFAEQCAGGTDDVDRIFELAVAVYESGSWGYSIVPHLDYSTARSLIRQSLRLETAVLTKTDQVELDLSHLKIVD